MDSTALQDQHSEAIEDCERLWPDNKWLVEDQKLEAILLDEVAQPRDLAAKVTLLWRATGEAVPLAAGDDVEATVLASAPESETLQCDSCEIVAPPVGFLVLPCPPRLAVLSVCGPCVAHFTTTFDPIRWVLPADRED